MSRKSPSFRSLLKSLRDLGVLLGFVILWWASAQVSRIEDPQLEILLAAAVMFVYRWFRGITGGEPPDDLIFPKR